MRGRLVGIMIGLVFILTPALWDFSGAAAQSDPLPLPTYPDAPTETFRGFDLPSTPAPYEFQRTSDELPILADIDFEQDIDLIFDLNGFGQFIYPPTAQTGRGLAVSGAYAFPFGYIETVRVTADVQLAGSGVYFSVRGSGAGDYRLELTPALIRLYRGENLLEEAKFPLDSVDFKLSFAARGNQLIAKLNGETILTYTDTDPLPYGVITFGAISLSDIATLVDNLRVEGRAAQDLDAGWSQIETMIQRSPLRLENAVTFPTDERLYFVDRTGLSSLGNMIRSRKIISDMSQSDEQIVGVSQSRFGRFSPDGTKFAFRSSRDGAYHIWVQSSNGNISRISQPNLNYSVDYTPLIWDTTSTKLLYLQDHYDSTTQIYKNLHMIYNFTTQMNIPFWGSVNSSTPNRHEMHTCMMTDWSFDNHKILALLYHVSDPTKTCRLFEIDIRDTSISEILIGEDTSGIQWQRSIYSATYSPTSDRIVILTQKKSASDIYYSDDYYIEWFNVSTTIPSTPHLILHHPDYIDVGAPYSVIAADRHQSLIWTTTQAFPEMIIYVMYHNQYTYFPTSSATYNIHFIDTQGNPLLDQNNVPIIQDGDGAMSWSTGIEYISQAHLTLDLSLNDPALDPNNLHIGDSIPVLARITNTGTEAAVGPIKLTLSLPKGLIPEQATNSGDTVIFLEPGDDNRTILDLLNNVISQLFRLLNSGVNPLKLTKDAADDTVFVEFTYQLDSLPAGGTTAFEFELVVQPEFAGVFYVEGVTTSNDTIEIRQLSLPSSTPQSTSGVTFAQDSFYAVVDECVVNVLGSSGVAFRYSPSLSNNDPLFRVNNSNIISNLANYPGQWNNVPNGNPDDWLDGNEIRLIAERLQQSGGYIWVYVKAHNSAQKSIEGYMALRQEGYLDLDFLSLTCNETSLPGYSGPAPTPTVGPSPTPNLLDWYVICTVRPSEQLPIFVNIRQAPDPSSQLLGTFSAGDKVRRTSVDPSLEVEVNLNGNILIYVEIEWQGTTAWVARQDSLGALLEPSRSLNCSLLPTATPFPQPSPTPDSGLPVADPGRFTVEGGYQSPFGSSAPANVGSYGIHNAFNPSVIGGTIDVMPAEIEDCVDTYPFSRSHECDPINGVGLPIYVLVSNTFIVFETSGNITIVMEDEYHGDDVNTDIPVRRREIVLTHLDPATFSVETSGVTIPITFSEGTNYVVKSNVPIGTKIGNLCLHNNRLNCGILDGVNVDAQVFAVNHLAVQVRFFGRSLSLDRNSTEDAYPTEVMGVLADPYCIFDVWKEIHSGSPLSPSKMKPSPMPFIQGWLLSTFPTQNIYAAC